MYSYIGTNIDIARKLNMLLKTNNISIDDIEKTINDNNFTNELLLGRNILSQYIAESNDLRNIKEFNTESANNLRSTDLLQQINQIDIQKLTNSIIHNANKLSSKLTTDDINIIKRRELIQLINNKL